MGYCMDIMESDFRMTAENCLKAKEQIQAAFWAAPDKRDWDDPAPTTIPRSWISKENVVNANTFPEMMRELRWKVEMDEGGNVVEIEFWGEKLGDDALFFQMLAPYVEAGCFIQMQGEDGEMWRWEFDGESCTEKTPTIIWE